MTLDLFSGIPVRDYAAALAWYEQLVGRPPAFFPNDAEAVWELADHRYIYIKHAPNRAGHALLTVFVSNVDSFVAQLSGRGLQPTKRETYANGVHKFTYVDPDGNEVGVGGPPEPAPATE
jgi:hypothetical protein